MAVVVLIPVVFPSVVPVVVSSFIMSTIPVLLLIVFRWKLIIFSILFWCRLILAIIHVQTMYYTKQGLLQHVGRPGVSRALVLT